MEQKELRVEVRTKTGKGISRRLRAQGLIPAVVYGKGMESVAVTLNPKELSLALSGEAGRNTILTLVGEGNLAGAPVIVADAYQDPIRGTFCHVDLHKINLDDKVRVEVPVRLVGTAIGVKEGGLLDFAMHRIEIECLPHQIPEHLDVDVTALTIGHSIHVGDLQVAPGIRLLEDAKASVVSVLGKAREEAPAAE
ncbi:MAG TPA: 50S ribosomal protein L25 [Geobacteraceae bacterium]